MDVRTGRPGQDGPCCRLSAGLAPPVGSCTSGVCNGMGRHGLAAGRPRRPRRQLIRSGQVRNGPKSRASSRGSTGSWSSALDLDCAYEAPSSPGPLVGTPGGKGGGRRHQATALLIACSWRRGGKSLSRCPALGWTTARAPGNKAHSGDLLGRALEQQAGRLRRRMYLQTGSTHCSESCYGQHGPGSIVWAGRAFRYSPRSAFSAMRCCQPQLCSRRLAPPRSLGQ